MGYWKLNNELIDVDLKHLANEGLIKYSDKYDITENWEGQERVKDSGRETSCH